MNSLRIVTKVRKKGVLILPKRVREAAGIREGDEVLIEAGEGLLVIRPLRPKIVDVDPSLLEELLREEYRLEARKHEEILKG